MWLLCRFGAVLCLLYARVCEGRGTDTASYLRESSQGREYFGFTL